VSLDEFVVAQTIARSRDAAVDIRITWVCGLDENAVRLPGGRQNANLPIGGQRAGLADRHGGRTRVRLGVVAGHHPDRVAGRSGIDRGLDRLPGFDRDRLGRSRRGRIHDSHAQRQDCADAHSD